MQPTDIGPVNALLKRRWGIVSTLGPIVTVASDMFPTARADLGMDADLHYLADQRICGSGRFDGPTAAQQSSIGLENPIDSGIIAIVLGCSVAGNAGQIQLTLLGGDVAATPFDTSANGGIRDARPQVKGESLASVCVIGDRTAAVAGNGVRVGLIQAIANVSIDVTHLGPWVLSPSSRLTVNHEATNSPIFVSFSWIERTLGKWEV